MTTYRTSGRTEAEQAATMPDVVASPFYQHCSACYGNGTTGAGRNPCALCGGRGTVVKQTPTPRVRHGYPGDEGK